MAEIVGCHEARGHGDTPPTIEDNSTTCCPGWGRWCYRSNPNARPKHAVHIELANAHPLTQAIHMLGRLSVPWRMDDQETESLTAALSLGR